MKGGQPEIRIPKNHYGIPTDLMVNIFSGPYKVCEEKLSYVGNRIFKPRTEVRGVKPPSFRNRHIEIKEGQRWNALIKIWDHIFRKSSKFMEMNEVLFFDLPITTRMISSPGALTGTISSDIDPFRIKFFDKTTFLTQSSQLYLEFAITHPKVNRVFCWEKSFRRERADFRHLPEFTHIEFEGNLDFNENLKFQTRYLQFLIKTLIRECRSETSFFLKEVDITALNFLTQLSEFKTVSFKEAFRFLKQKTGNSKYDAVTVRNFGAYEEVLLTEIIGGPVFVTNYINDEVAFYHARHPGNRDLVVNADLLFPGYGEIVGSGERVHARRDVVEKAKHFKLNMRDYRPYIESRDTKINTIHSGWGMGIERFIQAVLKLPFIWETKPFPRVDNQSNP